MAPSELSGTQVPATETEKANGSTSSPKLGAIGDAVRSALKTAIPGSPILKAIGGGNSNASNTEAPITPEEKGKGKLKSEEPAKAATTAPEEPLQPPRPAFLLDEIRPGPQGSGTQPDRSKERLGRGTSESRDPSPRTRDVQFASQNEYFGDEDTEGEQTPRGGNTAPGTPKRHSGIFKFSKKSGEYSREGEEEAKTLDDDGARPSLFSKLRAFSHSAAQHTRTLSGHGASDAEGGAGGSAPMSPIDQEEDESSDPGQAGPSTAPGTPSAAGKSPRLRRRATMTDVPEGSDTDGKGRHHPYSRRPSSFRRITDFAHSRKGSEINTAPSPGGGGASAAKWKALKAGIRMIGQKKKEEAKIDREKSAELVAELTAGIPAALIFASMFQRDEHGNKRIPIILEQLKIKITDSKLNNKSRNHTVFRIELEYGSGLTRMRWVIHREFRDFFNLHTKYRLQDFSNTYTSLGEGAKHQLPKFPRASIPYLKGWRGLEDSSEDSGNETATNTRLNSGATAERPLTANAAVDPSAAGPSSSAQTATAGSSNLLAVPRPGPPVRQPTYDDDSEDYEMPRKNSIAGSIRRTFSAKKRPPVRRNSTGGHPIETIEPGNIGAGIALGIGTLAGAAVASTPILRRDGFSIKQRKKLEKYLQELIRIMIFRPDSNRLCKFLELSSLGIRLAAENSYHGKEGYLIIQSSKGSEFRRGWAPGSIIKGHRPKWFLVRHSYIVCVDSPEEMNIYDVILVDSDFQLDAKRSLPKNPKAVASASTNPAHPQHHKLKLKNSERKIKLLAKNERQLNQFYDSIKYMTDQTVWSQKHRFDSFAPVRQYCFAQWLVDGRDYFWNVSRAISMAKDVIYIHDWWLSPEIYLRRPPAVSHKWRLDRLLQRKASEGVKIFVIIYRNIGAAIPIDSAYTKYSLLDLHPNIYVQRSPNQLRQNTFFWAHHEKLVIVDHTVVFLGGLDLCFGRWDTPQHALVDDKFTGFDETGPKDPDKYQLWPGKDYSNPRVEDFYELNKPYEDMYERQKTPRMPWHDISMQVVGQPARDLTRHFVQRWNYLLRQRTPSRPTPFLLPPPDFTQQEIESLGISGSCEVQMLRSACAWSTGTVDKNEHSILNAYLKAIETSDHLVYIENQFFITSGELPDGTKMENSIGDALVERIIRAHKNDEDWRAIIIIPLLPGFQSSVDQPDGSSVRLIMQCQFRSICRGEGSIFGKLKANGISPEDYIEFYALRSWGKIGPQQQLVTEQLYIHAKCMVVDDRIAIIGSANINERSMLGFRDSEVAAVVRDQDTIWSTMAGRPYLVGRFAHTLRLRLMREHLGIDVDELMVQERAAEEDEETGSEHRWHDGNSVTTRATTDLDSGSLRSGISGIAGPGHAGPSSSPPARQGDIDAVNRVEKLSSFNHDVDWEQANNPNIISHKRVTSDPRVKERERDVQGLGIDHMKAAEEYNREKEGRPVTALDRKLGQDGYEFTSSFSQVDTGIVRNSLESSRENRGHSSKGEPASVSHHAEDETAGGNGELLPPIPTQRLNSSELGLPLSSQLPPLPPTGDIEIGGPAAPRLSQGTLPSMKPSHPLCAEIKQPPVDSDHFVDPLNDSFYLDTWHKIALNNTKIFREVFRCMPDNEVKSWAQYKEYMAYADKFAASQDGDKPSTQNLNRSRTGQAAPGVGVPVTLTEKIGEKMPADAAETMGKLSEKLHIGPHSGHQDQDRSRTEELNEKTGLGDGDAGIRERNEAPGEVRRETGRGNLSKPSTGEALNEKDPMEGGDPRLSETSLRTGPPGTAGGLAPPGSALSGSATGSSVGPAASVRRRKRAGTRSSKREFHATDDVMDKDVAEELLSLVVGHLVVWPYDWLISEAEGGNWLYSIDQLAPIELYN
ncbi:Phospholipase D1 [Arthrobotrys musiformis]|uniref:Phospholipase D1 n=1 Tax=Arthrobotrys musiformis TaxID=47236 RepID=A0AAV9W3G7_9PEZI